MADISLTNATVFPEDAGTGAPVDEEEGDYVSAGHLGTLTLNRASNSFVESGAEFTFNADNTLLTVSKTLAFIRFEGDIRVQNGEGEYAEVWDYPMMFMVTFPDEDSIPVESGGVNDVYLWINRSEENGAYLRIGQNVATPAGPSVQLGSVDPRDGTTTQTNRGAESGYTDADAISAINSDADHGTTASHAYTTSADLQQGGTDELNVGGLAGDLADPQDPKAHGNAAHTTNFSAEDHDHAGDNLGSSTPLNSVATETATAGLLNGVKWVEVDEDIQTALDTNDAVALLPNAVYPDQGARIDVPVETILFGNGATIEVSSDHDGMFLDNRAMVLGHPKIDVTTTSYTSSALAFDTRDASMGQYGFGDPRATTRADVDVNCPNRNAGSSGVHIYAAAGVYNLTLNVRVRRFDSGWRFENASGGWINGNIIWTFTEGSRNLLHHTGTNDSVRSNIRGVLQTSTGMTDRIFWNETGGRSFTFEGEVWDAMHCNQSALEGNQIQVYDWEQWRAETLMDNITSTGNNATSVVTRTKSGDIQWMNCNSGIKWRIEGTWVSGLGDHFGFSYDDGAGWTKIGALSTNNGGDLYIGGTVNSGYEF